MLVYTTTKVFNSIPTDLIIEIHYPDINKAIRTNKLNREHTRHEEAIFTRQEQ